MNLFGLDGFLRREHGQMYVRRNSKPALFGRNVQKRIVRAYGMRQAQHVQRLREQLKKKLA